MASAFSHAISAIAIGRTFPVKTDWKFWLLCVICSVVPDADVIAFAFGIPYEHMLGHRGLTHSILFSMAFGISVGLLYRRSEGYLWYTTCFVICTLSHAFLDAFTNGGLGVGWFIPFSEQRYFFGHRPIQVSPLSVSSFFSEWGWRVIKSELFYVWMPSIVWFALITMYQVLRKRA